MVLPLYKELLRVDRCWRWDSWFSSWRRLSHFAHAAVEGPTHAFIWEALSEFRGCKEKRCEDERGVGNV